MLRPDGASVRACAHTAMSERRRSPISRTNARRSGRKSAIGISTARLVQSALAATTCDCGQKRPCPPRALEFPDALAARLSGHSRIPGYPHTGIASRKAEQVGIRTYGQARQPPPSSRIPSIFPIKPGISPGDRSPASACPQEDPGVEPRARRLASSQESAANFPGSAQWAGL